MYKSISYNYAQIDQELFLLPGYNYRYINYSLEIIYENYIIKQVRGTMVLIPTRQLASMPMTSILRPGTTRAELRSLWAPQDHLQNV